MYQIQYWSTGRASRRVRFRWEGERHRDMLVLLLCFRKIRADIVWPHIALQDQDEWRKGWYTTLHAADRIDTNTAWRETGLTLCCSTFHDRLQHLAQRAGQRFDFARQFESKRNAEPYRHGKSLNLFPVRERRSRYIESETQYFHVSDTEQGGRRTDRTYRASVGTSGSILCRRVIFFLLEQNICPCLLGFRHAKSKYDEGKKVCYRRESLCIFNTREHQRMSSVQ